MTPRVSVIMPVYNAEIYVAEAIESVLSQTFTDFEFLIHDDGSTDGSLAIIGDYAKADDRIVVSSRANEGLAAALNYLIETARADILARMDADDICMPDRFERQVTYLDRTPDCILLGAHETTIDGDGRPITNLRIPTEHPAIDGDNICGVTSIRHPTVMMRRKVVLQCGGYDPEMVPAEDIDLWLRMAEIGKLANIPDIVLKYRVHENSISGSKRDLQRQMCHKACEAAWLRRGLTDMSFDYGDWRMADTPESRREFCLRYGWQAWSSGYRDTWRHYALKSVKQAPLSQNAWKLLIFGWLRRPTRQTSHQDG
jgi:glycosyltransferase involved in cell wall biosynthesis